MSLDVFLTFPPGAEAIAEAKDRIFIRDNGCTVEIDRNEWDRRFPGREPVAVTDEANSETVFEANITHNLNTMADAAGIYKHLWRPDELGVTKAEELIQPLRDGLARMESDPGRFVALNPKNGWGSYEVFVPWIRRYLSACEEFPEADVSVSR